MVKGDAWMNCYTGETVTKTQGLTSVAITNAQVLARCQPCTILFLDQTNPEIYIYICIYIYKTDFFHEYYIEDWKI